MQSEAAAASRSSPLLVFFAGVLPLAGFGAELATGMFAQLGCQLFPTPWHTAAVGLAVLLNLLLHLGLCGRPRLLPWRAAALALVTGTALLYALAQLPFLPIILFAFVLGLGVLAFAPYWTSLGLLLLWNRLLPPWQAAGRSRGQLLAIAVPLLLLPPGAAVGARLQFWHTARLLQLAAASSDRAEVLAAGAALRQAPLGDQLLLCAQGTGRWAEAWTRDDLCWFVDRFGSRPVLEAAAARLGFHRAHGRASTDYPPPPRRPPAFADDGFDTEPRRTLELSRSELEVAVEPDAALARIDWQLQFRNAAPLAQEADLDLLVPPAAVASGLSLWIAGSERPAAFGGVARVQAAYDEVAVRQRRDPALLQEVAPGQLRLRVFPVPPGGVAARVRVLLTVPLHLRDEQALLQLPDLRSASCRLPAAHQLTVADGGQRSQRVLPATALADTRLPFRRGALRAHCRDADGGLGQQLLPRAPTPPPARLLVVIDGSASVAAQLPRPEQLLAALPAGLPCSLFVADCLGCERQDGRVGDPELARWLAARQFAGGVDAVPALLAAAAAHTPGSALLWLHGQQALAPVPTAALLAQLRQVPLVGVAIAEGPNLVRQRLRPALRQLPRSDDLAADLRWLCAHLPPAAGPEPFAACERSFERTAEAVDGAAPVSDQLARLWAAHQARALLAAGDAAGAAQLATRYRLATAGAAAVVLETDEQYARHQLDPGAAIGTEPPGPAGGGPVPELPVWLLASTGLLVAALLHRRRVGRAA